MWKIISFFACFIILLLFSGGSWLVYKHSGIELEKLKTDFFSQHLKNFKLRFDHDNYITDNQRQVDILHYDLFFDLFPEKKKFDASAIIKGVLKTKGLNSLDLNFYDNFEINLVELNGKKTDYTYEEKLISIVIDHSIPDTFKVKIEYSGTPKSAGFGGFSFARINGKPLVYSISEPTYASTWFPCNDLPNDKALLDIRIKNDSSQVSVSNGVLVDVVNDNFRKTYHWKTIYPISTYLIALYSSGYKHFSDSYISINGKDTMDIDYYVLPNDYKNAQIDFAEHVEILGFLAETFGEYPFIGEKYGVAEFLWQRGAMEHQTITGVGSNLVGGKNFFLDIYIHEAAHQWWGNAVGLKSWKDIWLNEGFSSYCEALYFEYKSGSSALQTTMQSKRQRKFIGSLDEPGEFLFTNTVYNKGAWVLHMLRWELGDKIFFKILREYYRKYKYSNASTGDFKNVCESISGKNLDKFFDQWIRGVSEIELSYDWETKQIGDNYNTLIDLEQVQENYEEFHFLLEIGIQYDGDGIDYHKIYINAPSIRLTINSSKKPESILIDPNQRILLSAKSK
ncbi:MAG: M1 family metallopeptidase [Ignavibacteria bacterium]|nr:M1 family metallopeptidase [Ignavibacteria bacterium]